AKSPRNDVQIKISNTKGYVVVKCFFTIFTNNTVIPGLTRDLLNTCSAYTVLNWQIPGQARDDSLRKYFCFHKQ
ncbi:MAG: hypothetical protein JWP12_1054, partial [Bacteroidetes bacterium]|nr:hypothetical protein [Bacteroidota bacterium]